MKTGSLRKDISLMLTDPVMALFFILPFLIGIIFRITIPLASSGLRTYLGFDLSPWYDLIVFFALLLAPIFTGFAFGFLLVDESDARTLGYYSVLPLGIQGYLLKKSLYPFFFTIIAAPVVYVLIGIETSYPQLLYLPGFWAWLLILGLEGSIMPLILSILVKNKVEALTTGKAISIVQMAAIIPFLFPNAEWRWLFAPIPFYWPGELYISLGSQRFWFVFSISLVFHLGIFLALLGFSLKKSQDLI
jgi:fluoroquinolone transport system permease protein